MLKRDRNKPSVHKHSKKTCGKAINGRAGYSRADFKKVKYDRGYYCKSPSPHRIWHAQVLC